MNELDFNSTQASTRSTLRSTLYEQRGRLSTLGQAISGKSSNPRAKTISSKRPRQRLKGRRKRMKRKRKGRLERRRKNRASHQNPNPQRGRQQPQLQTLKRQIRNRTSTSSSYAPCKRRLIRSFKPRCHLLPPSPVRPGHRKQGRLLWPLQGPCRYFQM
jgi:hypothetical protein